MVKEWLLEKIYNIVKKADDREQGPKRETGRGVTASLASMRKRHP